MSELTQDYKIKVACSQVIAFLNCYDDATLNIYIPKEIINEIRKNQAEDYNFKVDLENFDPNSFSNEAIALILLIYNEYLANSTQKEKIDKFIESCKRVQYNPDNIFKVKENVVEESSKKDVENINNNENINDNDNDNKLMVVKPNIFIQLFQKIKNLFKKEN